MELIIETNPIYSDFVLLKQQSNVVLKETNRRNYLDQYINHQANYFRGEYFFTPLWYLHFIIWGSIIIFLFSNTLFIQL